MAVPSKSSTSLRSKFEAFLDITGQIKDQCTQQISDSSVKRSRALTFANFLADSMDALDIVTANANANGLLEYARAQVNNPSLDLISEYNAMKSQLVSCQNWLVANFPSTTGELRVYSFDVNKRFADIILTSPQLSAYKTQLTNLAATIA